MLSSLPPFLGALTLILSVLAGIVSFTKPVLGALVKVSLSPFPLLFSSPMFSRAHPLVLSSLLTILPPFSNSTSHFVAGVATFSDGPALPLLLQCIGNLALVMLCTLPSHVHSRFSVVCALLTTPLLAPRSLPVCSRALFFLRKVHGHTGACLPFAPFHPTPWPRWYLSWLSALVSQPMVLQEVSVRRTVTYGLDSPPCCSTCTVSLSMSSLTSSSQSGKTLCTPLTFLLLPFVFGVFRWCCARRPCVALKIAGSEKQLTTTPQVFHSKLHVVLTFTESNSDPFFFNRKRVKLLGLNPEVQNWYVEELHFF